MSSFEQKAKDAVLEAEAWKETARRWRRRALKEAGPWRRKYRKLEEELDDANEHGAEAAEKASALEEELRRATAPLEKQLAAVRASLLDETKKAAVSANDLEHLRRKMGTAGTVEALIVERDQLKEQVAEQKSRVLLAAKRETDANSRAYKAEQEMADGRERVGREQVMPAKARIRVLATRLGISPSWPGYSDDEKLTAELDRRITVLQGPATSG